MRTARAVTVIAFSLVLGLSTIALPALAGCSSLVGNPSGCATAIYNSAKGNAGGIAAQRSQSLAAWAGSAPGAAVGCSPEELSVPAAEWDPQPAIDSNRAYAEDQRAAVDDFRGTGPASVFADTSQLGNVLWDNTADVVQRWNDHVFDPLATITLGLIAEPSVPDPSGWVADLDAFTAAAAASADCAQGAPLLPAL